MKGLNKKSIMKIIMTLQRYPEGLWLSQLQRETKIPMTTLNYYLDKMSDILIDRSSGRRGFTRIITLRYQSIEMALKVLQVKKQIKGN